MKVGLGSYAFRWSIGIGDYRPERPMGPVELLRAAADAGAEVLQFAENLPLDQARDETVADLAQAARATGVSVQLGTNTLDAGHVERQAALAAALDAGLIRIAPAVADMEGGADDLVRRLREVGDTFAALDCVVALENHFLLAPAVLADLVARTDHPFVTVCLDVANSIANGEWPERTIATLAPYAGNLHLKDYRVALDPHGVGLSIVGTPLGEGRMDLDLALEAVAALPRAVDIIVEHWLPRATFASHDEARRIEADWSARGVDAARRRLRQRAAVGESAAG
jgi:sugar phosphate isomerase/epimerase